MGKQSGPENLDPIKNDDSKQAANNAASALSNEALPGRLALKPHTDINNLGQGTAIQYPALNALSVRAVYYGVQGRLFPSMDQIKSAMLESGPIGQAAVNRMDKLGQKGWSFGALGPSDSLIARQIGSSDLSSLPKRLGLSLMLGGYNDSATGRITHNAFTAFVHTTVGLSNGADKDAANKYIHELAHGKSSLAYEKFEATPGAKQALKELPELERARHGKLMIEEELRALFAQVAANKASTRPVSEFLAPHTAGIVNIPPEQAIKKGELGRLVKDVWVYDGPKSLSIEEANKIANDYIKNTYGKLFTDGKLNPAAEAAVAKEISQLEVKAPTSANLDAPNHLSSSTFSPKYMGYLSRGAQSLGSLGLAVTVSDLRNQYSQGFAPGTGRLLAVGADWAGFEAGLAAGSGLGKTTTGWLLKINPKLAMVAAPLTAMGAGLVSTHITHDVLSTRLEKATTKKLSSLLE
ncbi:MAG: hypothetical protein K2X77_24675 [Candidatus Obscuribacterales bacterium]|nr:hypothetical protein [Candidatus Obscuribacterales bacterium]